MNNGKECRQTRELWMELFDNGECLEALSPLAAAHLESCHRCREFTTEAVRTRSLLTSVRLPAPNFQADRELLAALSQPVRRAGWLERLRLVCGQTPGGMRPLLAAGVASFAITLAVGATLASAPIRPSAALQDYAEEAPTRRAEGDYESRLEAWLAEPAARLRPQRLLTFPRRPAPRTRTNERSDRVPLSQHA